MSGGQQKARQLIPLDWGQYLLLDGIIYRSDGASPSDKISEILIPVDPNAHQMSRAVPITSRKMQPWKWVNASALFFGQHAKMLAVGDDGTVWVGYERHQPRNWPEDRHLGTMGDIGRGGYWTGKAELSELTDIDDDLPDEWRPFLLTVAQLSNLALVRCVRRK